MAKAHWDNAEVIETLRSREPGESLWEEEGECWEAGMLLSLPSLNLLRQVKSLPKWEIEMLLECIQEHLTEL